MGFQRPRDTQLEVSLICLRADRNITAPSSPSDVLLSAGCRRRERKRREKKKSRMKQRKKSQSGVLQLKVHYADCRVKMPPFCGTNFSFTAIPSARMIHNGLETVQQGHSNQIRNIYHRALAPQTVKVRLMKSSACFLLCTTSAGF